MVDVRNLVHKFLTYQPELSSNEEEEYSPPEESEDECERDSRMKREAEERECVLPPFAEPSFFSGRSRLVREPDIRIRSFPSGEEHGFPPSRDRLSPFLEVRSSPVSIPHPPPSEEDILFSKFREGPLHDRSANDSERPTTADKKRKKTRKPKFPRTNEATSDPPGHVPEPWRNWRSIKKRNKTEAARSMTSQPKRDASPKKAKRSLDRTVDITHLLSLPQREAAERLGIQHVTFLRRFRKATGGRRWPFRRLRGIEGKINKLFDSAGPRDQSEIEKLERERRELLSPVSICL